MASFSFLLAILCNYKSVQDNIKKFFMPPVYFFYVSHHQGKIRIVLQKYNFEWVKDLF
jgi:hypothetical protein